MDGTALLNDALTLDEKLAMIDKMMAETQEKAKESSKKMGKTFIPADPSELTRCDGCE